ncbi:MAG TPA: hypothetical protein VG755_27700 [Nannocystaceae bacterium]|nr:hypothetical protein [Nannocystaceae bacterium]
MFRVLTVVLAGALAGCAHSRGGGDAEIDPDLQPLQPMAQEQAPVIEPDEEIGEPDAPGAELIGAPAPEVTGPTQHVVMEGEDASTPVLTGQPQRPKRGSFMTGIKMAPTGD